MPEGIITNELDTTNNSFGETSMVSAPSEQASGRDLIAIGGILLGGTFALGYAIKKIFFRKRTKYAVVEPEGEYFSRK